MQKPQDRLIRYLQDAHAVETGITGMLKDAVAALNNPQAKMVLSEHMNVTESQAQRLESRLKALGSEASGGKSLLDTVVGKISNLVNTNRDEYDKTTQDLIKAYATEHFEVGMYTSLIAYATAMGDTETAALGQEILEEELAASEQIFPLIEEEARLTYQAAVMEDPVAAVS